MPKTVQERLAARISGGRSPLSAWLYEHRAEIAAVLGSQHRPGWQALAETARESGVTDANGHPPTRHAIRKAWTTLQLRLPPDSSPPAQVPVTSSSPVQSVEIQLSPSPRPRNTFAVARFKPLNKE